jgi:hypothetical protein
MDEVNNQCTSTNSSCKMDGTAINANLTAFPILNEQQGGMSELDCIPPQVKANTGCIPKSQRNCPKLRNNDFLWV